MKTLRHAALATAAILATGALFALHSRAAERTQLERPLATTLRQRAKDKLGLTADQIAKIKGELKSEKTNITSLLNRLHDAHSALRAEIQKSDATETAVREAAAKLSVVESDLAVERLKLHAKIDPILTADQREQIATFEADLDQMAEHIISRVDKKLSE